MNCICKNEHYLCLGCYAEYIDRFESDYIKRIWCWGLGYFWRHDLHVQRPRSSFTVPKQGAGCFGGLCCCYFGDDSTQLYNHESGNVCKSVDVYCPCGSYKRADSYNMVQVNVKTPCFGSDTLESKPEPTGQAKVVPAEKI